MLTWQWTSLCFAIISTQNTFTPTAKCSCDENRHCIHTFVVFRLDFHLQFAYVSSNDAKQIEGVDRFDALKL